MDGRASLAGCLLASAWESGIRIPGLEGLRPRTRREAYGAQDAMASALEMPIVGWKVGAATPAIMAERGIEAPIPGPLYGPRSHASPATLPETDFGESSLESEFAFRTLAAIPPSDKLWKPGDLAGLVVAHAAFDLTQSRFSAPPDALSEIADSGNSGGAVIGPEIPDWRSRNLLETEVELRVDGGARVRTYCGEWRRDPLDVMAWLVSSLGRRNIGLEAGAFVLTGSVTEPQEIVPGSSAVATFGGAARVLMRVGDEA